MFKVCKEPNADSRTAKENLTQAELEKATLRHIKDVGAGMAWFASELNERGEDHDKLKVSRSKDFFDALTGGKIKETDWYRDHVTKERHHLNAKGGIPKDINFFDVIEHMMDCIIAGMCRSGEVYDVELPAHVLKKAHENTIELIKQNVQVVTESVDMPSIDDLMSMDINAGDE